MAKHKRRPDLDDDDSDGPDLAPEGIAFLLLWIGIGCLTYRLVPYYGATPIAMGAWLILWVGVARLLARRS
jgi:hypothetical protein